MDSAAPDSAAEAGAKSPHLDAREQRQAASRAPLGPLVIHEIVREQGEVELRRSFSGLALSALASGLSIGFSMLVEAYLQSMLPRAPWSHLIAGFGYSVGFLIVILGRQQLFTETTLTALIPTLTRRDLPTLRATLRVWGIVLAANLAGTWAFGAIAAQPHIFSAGAQAAMADMAREVMGAPFWVTAIRGGSAGWLIGLMVWLLPSAGPSRPLIIILLTYVIALCGFPHVIAGSVESSFAVAHGTATLGEYCGRFLAPTLLGNVFGGTVLAALLNHAPVASELTGTHGQVR